MEYRGIEPRSGTVPRAALSPVETLLYPFDALPNGSLSESPCRIRARCNPRVRTWGNRVITISRLEPPAHRGRGEEFRGLRWRRGDRTHHALRHGFDRCPTLGLASIISGNSEVVILAYTPDCVCSAPGIRTQTLLLLRELPLPVGLERRAPVALHASCAERQPPGCLVVFESTRLRDPAHPSCRWTSCPSPGQQPPQRQPPPWKARGRRPGRTPGTSRHRCAGRPSRPSRCGTCQT